MRSAIGFKAAPESPPVTLASFGLRVFRSIAIPVKVLIIVKPAAPPLIAALASGTMSVMFGVSLT